VNKTRSELIALHSQYTRIYPWPTTGSAARAKCGERRSFTGAIPPARSFTDVAGPWL